MNEPRKITPKVMLPIAGVDDKLEITFNPESRKKALEIIDQTADVADFWGKAIEEIKELDGLTGSVIDDISHAIKAKARSLGATMAINSIRQSLITSEMEQVAKNQMLRTLSIGSKKPFVKDFVFMSEIGQFYEIKTGSRVKPGAFDIAFASQASTDDKSKPSRMFDVLGGRKVHRDIYFPMPDERLGDPVFMKEGKTFINTYRGSGLPSVEIDENDPDAEVIKQHFFNLFNDDDAKKLLEFCAWQVQRPGQKVRWAILLTGPQGSGKTTFKEILSSAMGRHNVSSIDLREIKSNFTGWADGKCLGVIEELRVIGQNRHDIMNGIKQMIANDEVTIVKKGVDGFTCLNVQNYMAFSNFDDALALDDNDRRWMVIDCKCKTRAEVDAIYSPSYWDRLYEVIHSKPEKIRAFLKTVDLTEFNPHKPPEANQAKREMVEEALSNTAKNIMQVIQAGCSVRSNDSRAMELSEGFCDDVVSTTHLNIAYDIAFKTRLGAHEMARALKSLKYVRVDGKMRIGDIISYIYVSESFAKKHDIKSKSLIVDFIEVLRIELAKHKSESGDFTPTWMKNNSYEDAKNGY
jgi:energy-coupling factor transporter ATP-binding protein EcfA2